MRYLILVLICFVCTVAQSNVEQDAIQEISKTAIENFGEIKKIKNEISSLKEDMGNMKQLNNVVSNLEDIVLQIDKTDDKQKIKKMVLRTKVKLEDKIDELGRKVKKLVDAYERLSSLIKKVEQMVENYQRKNLTGKSSKKRMSVTRAIYFKKNKYGRIELVKANRFEQYDLKELAHYLLQQSRKYNSQTYLVDSLLISYYLSGKQNYLNILLDLRGLSPASLDSIKFLQLSFGH